MQLDKLQVGRPGTNRMPYLALCVWLGLSSFAHGQATQAGPDTQGESVEEIEVTGRRSLLSLRADIVDAEQRMFGLFNELNDVREFEISCEAVVVTTSRIAKRECVPVYMKRMRQNNVQNFLFSDLTPPSAGDDRLKGGMSMDVKGVQQTEQEMWFHNNPKHREFNTRFRELAAEHPELAAAALDLEARKRRLEELERQKKDGIVGRFFSDSGATND